MSNGKSVYALQKLDDFKIQKHNFEKAKLMLKQFSEKEQADFSFKRVETDTFFGLMDRDVTAREFNEGMAVVQRHFIEVNSTMNKVIREFGEVYNALDSLDRDYIQAILISIDSVKEVSKWLDNQQHEINQVIERQGKAVEVLQKFKKELSSYSHLKDIDKIWGDCQKWYQEVALLSEAIKKALADSVKHATKLKAIENSINDVNLRVETLDSELSQQKNRLQGLEQNYQSLQNNLIDIQKMYQELDGYKKQLLSLKHLMEVDILWDSYERQDKIIANLDAQVVAMQETFASELLTLKAQSESEKELFIEKIRTSYILSGMSIFVACAGILFTYLRTM